jgi:hypothetical protein
MAGLEIKRFDSPYETRQIDCCRSFSWKRTKWVAVAFWRNRDNRVRVGLRFYVFAAKGLSGSRCPAGRTTFLRFAGVWLRERGGWLLWVVRWGHFRRWWRGGVGEVVASCVPACGCGGEWFALLGCVGRLRRLGRQRQGEARID